MIPLITNLTMSTNKLTVKQCVVNERVLLRGDVVRCQVAENEVRFMVSLAEVPEFKVGTRSADGTAGT